MKIALGVAITLAVVVPAQAQYDAVCNPRPPTKIVLKSAKSVLVLSATYVDNRFQASWDDTGKVIGDTGKQNGPVTWESAPLEVKPGQTRAMTLVGFNEQSYGAYNPFHVAYNIIEKLGNKVETLAKVDCQTGDNTLPIEIGKFKHPISVTRPR
jgi:hypothetical protein